MGEDHSRIERLHTTAVDLDLADTEEEIYDLALTAADEVLDFDACAVSTVEDGEIVPKAASAHELQLGSSYLKEGEGIAGKTVETGETFVVDDLKADEDARPASERYQSALSIPVGEDGVFQAVLNDTEGFSETDRELGELLVTHVEHALDRVSYERTIRRERDQFEALFQNVPDAVIRYTFVDAVPRIDAVNSAFVRLFDREPADVVGRSELDALVPEDNTGEARSLYERVRAGDRIDEEVTRLVSGYEHPFLLRSVPIGADYEETDGFFIYTDIAEMKAREEKLRRQNKRLDSFAGIVSHDLRNPLSVASGNLHVVREKCDAPELENIAEAHKRMEGLIDTLLTLARKGQAVEATRPVDIETVARQAWTGVETREASLTVESDRTIVADADRLRQLFENLFRNSVEHAGTDVTVRVGPTDDGFYVGDDGPGIPEDIRDSIFEFGEAIDADGIGLGLTIVSEIANGHGWSVTVTDGRDGGARFEFAGVNTRKKE